MSKRSESMAADQLDNRWSYTDSKTNATLTAAIVAAPQSSKEVRHLDFFNLIAMNKNATNATVTASVKDASSGGTTLAQFALLLGVSSTTAISPANIHLTATPGQGLIFTLDTVAPSVTVTVNAAGWTDQWG